MLTIDLDRFEQHPHGHSPYRVPMMPSSELRPRVAGDSDPAMTFAALILLLASLVRLAPPLTGHEAFGVEPTLALGATLGCGWLALREGFWRLRERVAARTMVPSRTID
jgi:hypothetical protein